jgi:hypothetical protein
MSLAKVLVTPHCHRRHTKDVDEKTGIWNNHGSGVFEAIAHITTQDGRTHTLPAITSVRLKGNRVGRLLLLMDASPLFHVPPQRGPIRSLGRPQSPPFACHIQEVP